MSKLRVDELESINTGKSILVDEIDSGVRADLANPDKGAAMISFKQTGAGAVARTQRDKNSDVRTLRDFGAVGDGITDDTKAFQAAIDAGGLVYGVYGDTYLLSRQYKGTASTEIDSYCVHATRNNSVIDLQGATIKRQKIGEGDSIEQYPIASCTGDNKLTIKNGIVDFDNHNVIGFVYSMCSKPDQGLINLKVINTVNNGVPRTKLANNNAIVFIISCSDNVYVKDSEFYVGSNGDLTGDAPASFDNPSFGVRIITNAFSAIPDDPTIFPVKNCYVVNSKFYGAFTWQPIEIGGTKAFDCYMKDIFMYKPVLTAIDIDKGAVRCYAKNIQIVSPGKGLQTVPQSTGAWEYIVMRIQGNSELGVSIYADSCWVEDVDIYDLPNDINHYVDTDDNLGTLACFAHAKNSRFTNIRVHNNGALRWLVRSFGEESLNNVIEKLSGGHYLAVTGDSVGTGGVVDTGNIRILNSDFGCYRGVIAKDQYKISVESCNIKSSVAIRNNVPSYFLGLEADSKAEVTVKNSTFTGFWKAIVLTDNLPTKLYLQGNKFLEQEGRSAVNLIANSVDNVDHVKGDEWSAVVAYSMPSMPPNDTRSDTVSLQGVVIGDNVVCSMTTSLQGMQQWCEVTSANTVTVFTRNTTANTVTLPTADLKVTRLA